MENSQVLGKLQNIFRQNFFDDSLEIKRSTTADDVVGWDSLNHVNLIVRVEEEFKVSFDISEVAAMKNVGDLVDLIEEKLV